MKRLTRSLPFLGALAVFGTAAGVSLGHSAVSEINPLYFTETPDRFHADQTAQRPNWDAPQPLSAPAPVSADGLGDGCFACGGGGRVEYYAAPAVVTYSDSWSAEAERAAAPEDGAFVQQAAPDPERERVIRYASYRITADEPETAPEPAEAEPAVDVYAAADVSAM
jgi:hypothetical protein